MAAELSKRTPTVPPVTRDRQYNSIVMSETAAAAPASEPVKAKSPKKRGPKAAGGSGGAKAKSSHPPTAQMVTSAVGTLKERGGSSLQAIKKYISATYKVDAEKLAPFIRKYIKSAVASGKLVQTKGSGASGSFKLPGDEGKKKKAAAAAGGAAAKPKAKKPAKVEKKKSPVKTKAPKAKKTKKPPTTPKAPKPKKAVATKVKTSSAKPKKPSPAKKAAKKPAASAKRAAPKKK